MRRNQTVCSRITITTVLVASSLYGVMGPLYAGGSGAPDIFYSNLNASEHPDPIWVSAAELVKGGGELDWNLLGEHAADRWAEPHPIEKKRSGGEVGLREASREECIVMDVSSWPDPVRAPQDGLEALVRGAKVAFTGRVVESTPGFLVGSVATVLTVEVTEIFHVEAPVRPSPRFYVAYPQAVFALHGRVFCGFHQKGPDVPAVGTDVVILSQYGTMDEQDLLLQTSVKEVVSTTDVGSVVLPPNLQEDEDLHGIETWDGLLKAVRQQFGDVAAS